jgi:hypothetical protein
MRESSTSVPLDRYWCSRNCHRRFAGRQRLTVPHSLDAAGVRGHGDQADVRRALQSRIERENRAVQPHGREFLPRGGVEEAEDARRVQRVAQNLDFGVLQQQGTRRTERLDAADRVERVEGSAPLYAAGDYRIRVPARRPASRRRQITIKRNQRRA